MSADPEAVTFPTLPSGYYSFEAWEASQEAWAWRCADTMPDTAQGRWDSEADARTLEAVVAWHWVVESTGALGCSLWRMRNVAPPMLRNIRYGNQAAAVYRAKQCARAAFGAVPELRGEP